MENRIWSGTFSLTRHTFVQFACLVSDGDVHCTTTNDYQSKLYNKKQFDRNYTSKLYTKSRKWSRAWLEKSPAILFLHNKKGGIEKSIYCWGQETSNTCLFPIKLNTWWVSNVKTFKSIHDSLQHLPEKNTEGEKAQYVIVQSKEGKKSTLIELFDWSRGLVLPD